MGRCARRWSRSWRGTRAESVFDTPVLVRVDDARVMKNLESQRIGPYQLTSKIGAGGMGEVCKALDTRLDRTVAIKVLTAHLADDPTRANASNVRRAPSPH